MWPKQETEGPQLASMTIVPSSRTRSVPLPATNLVRRDVEERWRTWEPETSESMAILMGITVLVATGSNFVGSMRETSQARHQYKENG